MNNLNPRRGCHQRRFGEGFDGLGHEALLLVPDTDNG